MGASGLGALLVKEGFLTEQDRVTITKTCGQGSWAFAKCILSTGLLDEDELSAFFAERTKYVVAPKNLLDQLDPGIVELVDRRMVSRLEVLPLEIDHHRITVAVADPLDKSTLKQLEFFTGLEVVPVIAPLSQIHEGLNRLNPEFIARPTALSNFLRNHAGAAWIKQKIVEEGGVEMLQNRQSVRSGALDDYDEDQVEDVSLDDEIDAMDDDDAASLDEGIGTSDFDDIDLEDSGSDFDLAAGDDPDPELDAGESIDDVGLDLDDPFDSFDDAPKAAKAVAASAEDELEGLTADDDATGDLWSDLDDEPAKPAAIAKAKAKSQPAEAASDDFDLDDEPTKPAKKAEVRDDFDQDDEGEQASLTADSIDDFDLDDEPTKPAATAKAKAKSQPTVAASDDFDLDDEATKPAKKAEVHDDFDQDDEGEQTSLTADSIDDFDLDDEPSKPAKKVAASDDFGLDDEPKKPGTKAKTTADVDDDLLGEEPDLGFDDEETSVSLRKAVHEDGAVPEFNDPSLDDEASEEETRIDLHTAIADELQFDADSVEETNLKLQPKLEKPKRKAEPAIDAADDDPLEDLAMGFHGDESIDDPAGTMSSNEPLIDDLIGHADLDDIPIDTPAAPDRAGGLIAAASMENGSVASLTATAKANEALLRLSLCFDRSTAWAIAREYLPQISATGCLVDLGKTTEALATWRAGAESVASSKAAAFQHLAQKAKVGQWSEIFVRGQDDIFGSLKTVSVYKIEKDDGRILLLAGDYPVEDESLRDALTSFAEQLGAK